MAVSNKLTARMLKAELARSHSTPKIISDGDGLYVRIRPDGNASWFFAKKVNGRRRELGLGSVTAVDMDLARELAGDVRKVIAQGRDPFAEKAASKREVKHTAKVPTFGAFAEDYVASIEAGFRNKKHVAQWRSTLATYAAPLSKMRVDEITTDDVLRCLEPIWTEKPETASRVRGRIEKVLSAAKAKKLRPRDSFNPATWHGHLQILLPKRHRDSRGHHAAMPYKMVPEFMAKLRTRPALAARALEFTILTAARTGETIAATWGEIDLKDGIWIVSASRMKMGKEHRVPLSSAAVALLKRLRPEEAKADELVFGKLSNMAMAMLLRRMELDVTVHGMRSSFRDWAAESTSFPHEVCEMALAHTIGNKAEAAYRRGDLFAKRRKLMDAWADFLEGTAEAKAA